MFCAPRRLLALAAACLLLVHAAAAQDLQPPDAPDAPDASDPVAVPEEGTAEPPPPIYDEQLLRLSEILGSLAFLRDLCGAADAERWRREMQSLLAAESPSPQRTRRLVGRFNHGFETYFAVYRSCTPSAHRAIERYLAEGAALSGEVRSRYSH